MGYTHYWEPEGPFEREPWDKATDLVRQLLEQAKREDVRVAGPHGTGDPIVTESMISLNGAGRDAFETFCFLRDPERSKYDGTFFGCCKTGHQRYDVVVVAVLCVLEHVLGGVGASSDGDAEDWATGLELARTVCPAVRLPSGVATSR